MNYRWGDYVRNAQLETKVATLATFAVLNFTGFSASGSCLKCHCVNSFHFLKACFLLGSALGKTRIQQNDKSFLKMH